MLKINITGKAFRWLGFFVVLSMAGAYLWMIASNFISDPKTQKSSLNKPEHITLGSTPQIQTVSGWIERLSHQAGAVVIKLQVRERKDLEIKLNEKTKVWHGSKELSRKGVLEGEHVRVRYIEDSGTLIARTIEIVVSEDKAERGLDNHLLKGGLL